MNSGTRLRFGLVGTGHWARVAHAPALAASPDAQLTAVWGRDPAAAGALATEYGATACADIDELLGSVDAVAFAVPPDVQAPIAVRAAAAGRHLLLEKPVALTVAAADEVASAVAGAGVASVVFFTARFQDDVRAWLTRADGAGPWLGGSACWLGEALTEGNPFNTPWRRVHGGLWDLGPHVVSLLWASLGPVATVTADAGAGDLAHLVLHHAGGATSTVTVTLSAPPKAAWSALELWGEAGRLAAPMTENTPAALAVAVRELAANVRAGRTSHPCDAAFGRDVVRVLASAQTQLDARRAGGAQAGREGVPCG
jgi:predicted dehydrogenase